MSKPDIPPAYLTAIQAAQYLNVSRAHFERHIRQHVPSIDAKPATSVRAMWRWMPNDLDRFMMDRRKES